MKKVLWHCTSRDFKINMTVSNNVVQSEASAPAGRLETAVVNPIQLQPGYRCTNTPTIGESS